MGIVKFGYGGFDMLRNKGENFVIRRQDIIIVIVSETKSEPKDRIADR